MILHLNEHTWIPVHSEMFVPSFLQRKETILKNFKPLPIFIKFSLKRMWSFKWTNLNRFTLCQVKLKFAWWFWRKRLKVVDIISFLSPYGKRRGPSLDQTWISHLRIIWLMELGLLILKKKINILNRWTDKQTTQSIRELARTFSSGEQTEIGKWLSWLLTIGFYIVEDRTSPTFS